MTKAEFKFRDIDNKNEILELFYLHLTQYFEDGYTIEQLAERTKIDNNMLNIEIKINGIPIKTKEAILALGDRYDTSVEEEVNSKIQELLTGNTFFEGIKNKIQEIESNLDSLQDWINKNKPIST